jgi:hypothetical protein
MSSIILSAKHFNSVEKSLQTLMMTDFHVPYELKHFDILYSRRIAGTDAIYDEVTRIMNIIRNLSCECVVMQYKHHYKVPARQVKLEQADLLKHPDQFVRLNFTALYKAVECVNYQIELKQLKREVTQEEKDAVLFLRELAIALAKEIVRVTPEYDAAQWWIE